MGRFLNIALAAAALLSTLVYVQASDPELTTDFFVQPTVNISSIDGAYFTYTELRQGVLPAPAPGQFRATKAFSNVLPALTGLGVAYALLEYTPLSMNPPHTHPRGTELLYVLSGSLYVGVIDTTNKHYHQYLQQGELLTISSFPEISRKGDVFVFPKGLVHYQMNIGINASASALSAFSSSNPGTVSLPATLFGSLIPDDVLTKAFSVDSDIIHMLEAPFAVHANP